MKNIGMILNAPYPSDMRVVKESNALINAGFNVFLLCLRRPNESYSDSYQGIQITRIDAGKSKPSLAFWDVVLSISFNHPRFERAGKTWIKENAIEVLHVHDLPLVGTALGLKEKFNIPVVADFHENYPEALGTWFQWKKNPIARLKNYIFLNTKRWKKHEREAIKKVDHLIAVVDEMKARLLGEYPVDSNKITVVSNTEELSFSEQKEDPDVFEAFKQNFIVTYSGNIGPHRGVDTVIESMKYIDEPSIRFLIVGSGSSAVMDHLKGLIQQYNVASKVVLLGRLPFEKFYSIMKFSDANIIPHKSNPHTDNTVPHKLFQAMMVAKPVIVSSCPPLRRIVSSLNSGVVFEAGNPRDCADKIMQVYLSKEDGAAMGKNGYEATVNGNLNWEYEQKHLVGVYNSLSETS